MATDEVRYLSYLDALFIHFELMRLMGEPRRGVFDRSLVESALARPWLGGNKRTATAIVNEFLKRNGFVLAASIAETLKLVLAVEADQWKVDEIENWLRQHTTRIGA